MGTKKSGKQINYSHGPAQTKQQVELEHSWSTFGAPMNHEQTQTHKTQTWEKPPPSPL
jgi:hypothetical protein